MSESVRHGDQSPASSGRAFEPTPQPSATGTEPTRSWGEFEEVDVQVRAILDGDGEEHGIDPTQLGDEDLIREMASLHRTRLDTLRHGGDAALATHLRRTAELETEYLVRFPGREINPARLRHHD